MKKMKNIVNIMYLNYSLYQMNKQLATKLQIKF